MRNRKAIMDQRSDAFIVLPGGSWDAGRSNGGSFNETALPFGQAPSIHQH